MAKTNLLLSLLGGDKGSETATPAAPVVAPADAWATPIQPAKPNPTNDDLMSKLLAGMGQAQGAHVPQQRVPETWTETRGGEGWKKNEPKKKETSTVKVEKPHTAEAPADKAVIAAKGFNENHDDEKGVNAGKTNLLCSLLGVDRTEETSQGGPSHSSIMPPAGTPQGGVDLSALAAQANAAQVPITNPLMHPTGLAVGVGAPPAVPAPLPVTAPVLVNAPPQPSPMVIPPAPLQPLMTSAMGIQAMGVQPSPAPMPSMMPPVPVGTGLTVVTPAVSTAPTMAAMSSTGFGQLNGTSQTTPPSASMRSPLSNDLPISVGAPPKDNAPLIPSKQNSPGEKEVSPAVRFLQMQSLLSAHGSNSATASFTTSGESEQKEETPVMRIQPGEKGISDLQWLMNLAKGKDAEQSTADLPPTWNVGDKRSGQQKSQDGKSSPKAASSKGPSKGKGKQPPKKSYSYSHDFLKELQFSPATHATPASIPQDLIRDVIEVDKGGDGSASASGFRLNRRPRDAADKVPRRETWNS